MMTHTPRRIPSAASILGLIVLGALSVTGCDFGEFDESMNALDPNDPTYLFANTDAPQVDPRDFNPFIDTYVDRLATFSVDVDTASYTIMRRALNEGKLPNIDRMRVEEFLNYFAFDYPAPTPQDPDPFSITLEAAPSVFGPNKHMLRVGVKAMAVPEQQRPHTNVVLLIDISGSMSSYDRIGYVKYAAKTLVNSLRESDTIGIVVYAGAERTVLEPTAVGQRTAILNAIDSLTTGGSTAGEAGLRRAYELAERARCSNNVALYQNCTNDINRVVLFTDGDFNVGLAGDALIEEVEAWRNRGVFLSVFGVGSDFNDAFLETLTNKGNGNYYYVDSLGEARRVLADALGGTMQVVAKDVKVQVEFNPEVISRFRLVGYENRVLNHEDFVNDKVDAGDIGSGHNVTALIEFELRSEVKRGSGLQVMVEPEYAQAQFIDVRVRYKRPSETMSREVVKIVPLESLKTSPTAATDDFRFALAVAEFAEILRASPFVEAVDYDAVHALAESGLAADPENRGEFLQLIRKAQSLTPFCAGPEDRVTMVCQ